MSHIISLTILSFSLLISGFAQSMEKPNVEANATLLQAAYKKDLKMVEHALAEGADPHARDEFNETALGLAIRQYANEYHRQTDIIAILQTLIKHGARVNEQTGFRSRFTPLIRALMEGQDNVARFLIDNGADVNFASSDGHTPLHTAARRGWGLELLIEHGANLEARDDDGATPLFTALEGLGSTLNQLLNAGAEVDVYNDEDLSPLAVIFTHGFSHKSYIGSFLRLLLMYGATIPDYLIKQISGELNVFERAVVFGTVEEAKEILQSSQVENIEPVFDVHNQMFWASRMPLVTHLESALALAAGQGRISMVHFLLEQGAAPPFGALHYVSGILRRYDRRIAERKKEGKELLAQSQEELATYQRIQTLLLNSLTPEPTSYLSLLPHEIRDVPYSLLSRGSIYKPS